MNWRCALLWWHKIVAKSWVSGQSQYFRCSCGREYAINHDVRCVLPWDSVRSLYVDSPCANDFAVMAAERNRR